MAKKPNGRENKGRLSLYRSYNFVEKDPVIDRIRTIVQREHVDNNDVAKISGVSSTTLHGWFDGKTRRPQYATIAAVITSLGYSAKFVKTKRVDVAREVEKAAAEIAEAKEKLERQRQRAASTAKTPARAAAAPER
jgi:transcriptional regulator with XRE-family HTH domain